MRFWLTFLIILLPSLQARAQAMEGYVPPALFDVPPEIQPDKKFKRDKMPMLSREIEDTSKPPQIRIEKIESKQKAETKKVSVKPAASKVKVAKTAPKPKIKPQQPDNEVAVKTINKPQKPVVKVTPVKPEKVMSGGVVKGPKTMPAVKKQGVESEVTYEGNREPTIKIDAAPVVEKPEPIAAKKTNEATSSLISTQKIFSFDYQGSNDEITGLQQLSILEEIIPQLDINLDARVTIQSYAPILENYNEAAGRRIALSRALNIRKLLIDNAITPNRIDIRSLAADVPKDLVNLIKLEIVE